jgi:uncharacterized membrane protein
MMNIRAAMAGAVALAAVAAYAQAEPVHLRNGKWEVTYRGTEGGKQFSRTFDSCNRKAVSEQAMLKVMSEKGTCTRKALAHTGTSIELEIDCTAPQASKSVFKYEMDEGEKVTSSADVQRADGVKRHIEASARWVGACSSHS